jgi:heme A synthase
LLLVVTVVAFQLQQDPRVGEALFLFDSLSTMAGATALGVYLLLLTGVLVTATRAGAACGGWPLCDGALVPTTARGLLHMSHRYAGAAVGLLLLGTVVQAWRLRRANVPVVAAATVTGVLFGAQVLVGALNVLRGFPMLLNGLHIALAATVWASAVVFAVLAMLYVRYSPLRAAGRLRVNPKPALRVRTAEYFHL